MSKVIFYKNTADRRKTRVRAKLARIGMRPRLTVFRSNAHIFAQIVDDKKAVTLVALVDSKIGKDLEPAPKELSKGLKTAYLLGEALAKAGIKKGVKEVFFDRGEYLYHGRIKALADGARAGGLVF